MVYRPLRDVGRILLAACAVSLGVASLGAQTTGTTALPGSNPSRVDVFVGYSYFGAHGEIKPAGIPYSSINYGAMGSAAYYFNKYVGGELIFAAHPDGNNDGLYTASAGPIFRAPMQNFTLFAHALAGGGKLVGPNQSNPFIYHNPWQWGPTLTVGGGMDYDLPFFDHRFSVRLFQADYRYIHADYGPSVAVPTIYQLGGRANLGAAELSTGLVMHFGHIVPPPPVTYSCVASPSTIYPGDPITITGTALNLNPKKTASYTWSSDGGTVSGTSNVASVDTKTLNAGTYNVKGHVSEGAKPGEMADCTVPFTVKAYEPPTITCSASPSSMAPGDSATITANGVSPQNRPLTYSYSASAGSISGNTSTATLTTVGAAPGTITVTCNVVDDKGQTASTTTSVTLTSVATVAPTTTDLCSINFDRDKRRPARVDNEAKACLDDVALNLQRSSDAKLAIVGDADSTEKNGRTVAAQRAVNTKDYLVTQKGIDASRINVYTGTDSGKIVKQTLIPAGATMSSSGLTPVNESSVKAASRTASPTKRHKK